MVKMAAIIRHSIVYLFMILRTYCTLRDSLSQDFPSGSVACKTHNTSEMDCSRRNLAAVPVLDKNWTTMLDLSHNKLKEINGAPFENLPVLTSVDLSRNMISKLNSAVFNGLYSLMKLDLHDNQLTVLASDIFGYLRKLVYLDVSDNPLHDVPSQALETLHSVQHMYMNFFGSELNTVMTDFRSLADLRVLHILAQVNVTNDTFLPLAGLPIQEFVFTWVPMCKDCNFLDKSAFDPFTSVRKLSTDFKALPALGSLRSPLQTLTLESWVKGYPNALHNTTFQSLSKVNPVNTSLTTLVLYLPLRYIETDAFIWIPNLIKVVLKYSRLQTMDKQAFCGLNSLQTLDLGDNQLTAVPFDTLDVIGKFTSLHLLDLSSNSISEIADDAFSAISSLTNLNLGNNKIQDYVIHTGWLDLLQNLTHLVLGDFGLRSFAVEIDLPVSSLQIFELRRVGMVRFKTNFCPIFPNVVDVIISDAKIPGFPFLLALHECLFLQALDLSGSVSNIDSLYPNHANISIPGLKNLTLSRNKLTSIGQILFIKAPNLTSLNLSDNQIKNIDSAIAPAFKHLIIFCIDGNALVSLSGLEHLTFLKHLNAARNQITEVPLWLVSTTSAPVLITLDLSGNPFSCTCEIEHFRKWIVSDTNTWLQPGQYNCARPASLKAISISAVELDCRSLTAFYISVGIPCVMLFCMLIILLIRYRWHIRYKLFLLYTNFQPLPEINEDFEMLQLQYHAYIAYNENSEDDVWVLNDLQPNIEEGPEPMQLCIKVRDFLPGHSVIERIDESIQKSHKTILVLSPNFVESEWCYYEMEVAKMRLLSEDLDVIILVLLKEIPQSKMTLALRHLLCKKEYLKWPNDRAGQRLFWQRLRLELKTPVHIDRCFWM